MLTHNRAATIQEPGYTWSSEVQLKLFCLWERQLHISQFSDEILVESRLTSDLEAYTSHRYY